MDAMMSIYIVLLLMSSYHCSLLVFLVMKLIDEALFLPLSFLITYFQVIYLQVCTLQYGSIHAHIHVYSIMDPSKLKNKRWTALVPQKRQSLLFKASSSTSATHGKRIHLIGKLPEEAYIYIFSYIGIADIVNLSLTCREVHKLSYNETVWRNKLDLLRWKGDAPPEARKILDKQKQEQEERERQSRKTSLSQNINGLEYAPGRRSLDRETPSSKKPPIQSTNGTILSNNTAKRSSLSGSTAFGTSDVAAVSAPGSSMASANTPGGSMMQDTNNNDDDGFGDFVDFSSPTASNPSELINNTGFSSSTLTSTTNGLNGTFAHIDLNAPPIQPTKATTSDTAARKKQDEDLLMLFDDGAEDDIGLGNATPVQPPSKHVSKSSVSTKQQNNSLSQANGHSHASSPSFSASSSATQGASSSSSSSSFSRDLFIAYFKYLIPYYVSLQYQSTSSLIFTQTHPAPLSDTSKAYILTNLSSLLGNPSIAPTQYEETRLSKTKRNLKSSVDYFDAYLLNRFEKSNDSRIISDMREAAFAYCALHENDHHHDERRTGSSANGNVARTATHSNASDNSVIQIFISKIPLFYDNSWDPMANLT